MVTRDNFGCGSSREHAPWALLDYGFRCIIAPSFADIFYNNCFQNSILPITLAAAEVDALFLAVAANPRQEYKVDLSGQRIFPLDAPSKGMAFSLDESRKRKLLEGLDDIALTLQFENAIAEYERGREEN